MKVKCNQCGHIADEKDFPKGNDFFQNSYIAACPKCNNRQTPGNASMRGFGGDRPFSYVRDAEPEPIGPEMGDAWNVVNHRMSEAS